MEAYGFPERQRARAVSILVKRVGGRPVSGDRHPGPEVGSEEDLTVNHNPNRTVQCGVGIEEDSTLPKGFAAGELVEACVEVLRHRELRGECGICL